MATEIIEEFSGFNRMPRLMEAMNHVRRTVISGLLLKYIDAMVNQIQNVFQRI
jgi:hypothetical protein